MKIIYDLIIRLYEINASPEMEVLLFYNLCRNVPYFYDTLVASGHPFFSVCFTTHITFSADHGDQRLRPIPLPVAQRRPSRVHRYHPHTMGDDAYAWLCVI